MENTWSIFPVPGRNLMRTAIELVRMVLHKLINGTQWERTQGKIVTIDKMEAIKLKEKMFYHTICACVCIETIQFERMTAPNGNSHAIMKRCTWKQNKTDDVWRQQGWQDENMTEENL